MGDHCQERAAPCGDWGASANDSRDQRNKYIDFVQKSVHLLSPRRLVPLMVLSIFIAESGVMFLLASLPPLSVPVEALIDSTVLLIVLSPTFYFFHYRPIRHHYKDRKRIIDRLSHSEERLALALEAVNDGLCDWNLVSGAAYFSRRAHTMLGYQPGEFASNIACWKQMIHPEDKAEVELSLQAHLANRSSYYEAEHRLLKKNGDWLWVLTRGQVVERDENGRALRMLGTYTDIGKRKLTEETLRNREKEIRALTRRLLSTAEDEKKHLAQDLHDEFGQVLTAFQFGVEMLCAHSFKDEADYQAQCARLLKLVARLETDLRHMCDHLRPIMLDDVGLIATLQWHIREFRLLDRSLQVRFQVKGQELPLPRAVNIVLYRIVQESLNNVVKHADAERVEIDIAYNEERVVLTIKDDGHGFVNSRQRSVVKKGTGFGLLGMRERAAAVNGLLQIKSEADRGTLVHVELPLTGDD